MNVNIIPTKLFSNHFKTYVKKYRSLKSDFESLLKQIEENPETGTKLGNNIYKIRLAVKSKGKGKSGGFRLITQVEIIAEIKETDVYLLEIYDKSEIATIHKNDILKMLQNKRQQ